MGGYGGINSMIQLLNINNIKLKRNSQTYFKRKNNDYRPSTIIENNNKPKFTEAELKEFKDKLNKERQSNNIKRIILLFSLSIAIGLFAYYLLF